MKWKRIKEIMCVCMCQVAARQFPVERHFAARTEEDYLAAAYKMVSGFYVTSVLFVRWSGGVEDDNKKKAWNQNRGLHICCLQLQDGRCFLCHHCVVCEAGWLLGVRESGFESGQRAH